MLGSIFCRTHLDWADACADEPAQQIRIIDHRKASAVAGDGDELIQLKIEEGIGDEAETRWASESEVAPSLVAAYFLQVGEEVLHRIASRRAGKKALDKQRRAWIRRAMVDFQPIWDSLTPEERTETMSLFSSDADLHVVSCSTHKEGEDVRCKNQRTAGLLVACLTSGVVIAFQECFGAESLSQRSLFAAKVKALYPELVILVHDDACHMHKFTAARHQESAFAASLAPPALRHVCDGFHLAGHTDPWCLVNCNLDAPDVAEAMLGIRTSVCEFTFTWLSAYKYQTKHMSHHTFNWFMLEMLDAHNKFAAVGRTDHLPKAVAQDVA